MLTLYNNFDIKKYYCSAETKFCNFIVDLYKAESCYVNNKNVLERATYLIICANGEHILEK